ncbi:MAG: preprotein translocase subunit SecG [Arenimonas sp.]|nr:preprotein translocase subunit SecG [Arenimonas sp.]
MIDTILQIVYIVIAVAMVVLVLLQRGSGAQAGAGFGAGASGTVFGSRGSANFMTTSTKWLAFAFFGLSLFMAWKSVNINKPEAASANIGVMSSVPVVPESATPVANLPPVSAPVPEISVAPEAIAPVTPAAPEALPAPEQAPASEQKK